MASMLSRALPKQWRIVRSIYIHTTNDFRLCDSEDAHTCATLRARGILISHALPQALLASRRAIVQAFDEVGLAPNGHG